MIFELEKNNMAIYQEICDNTSQKIEMMKTFICAICGGPHITVSCDLSNITDHIFNRATSTKARLSLPNDFVLYTLADGSSKVVSNRFIRKGTRFGPLEATKSLTLNPAIQFPLKIFPTGEDDFLEYYLDTLDEETSTWMIFIPPAENCDEQNLICYQEEQHIYYISIRDIDEGESLKVWYAPYYAEKMGKNLLEKLSLENSQPDVPNLNKLVKSQKNIPNTDTWTCKFCNMLFNEIIKFANHLIEEHYKSQLVKICKLCKATFKTRKCLCQHIVQNQYKNKINLTPNKTIETLLDQNSSKEISIGGPLLNSMITFDNSDLMMPTECHLNEDSQNLDVENLNIENLFITENFKALDYFNLEIEETKEGYICDVCFKNFSKLPNLIQHLKGHRGDFYCSSCNKVFGRKENLTHHACNTSTIYECSECQRTFPQKKYYKRHMDTVHDHKFKCNNCQKSYSNNYELSQHKCMVQLDQNQMYVCNFCKKTFSRQRNLKKHISRQHTYNKVFICEICSKQYTTKNSYEMHAQTHKEPQFKCEICEKEFHRKDTMEEHKDRVHSNKELQCDICDKKFKAKKNLMIHKETHKNTKFNCPTCGSSFKTKSNLTRHIKTHQKNDSIRGHFLYQCKYCGKKMKLRSSLARHIQNKHTTAEDDSQEAVKESKVEEPGCLQFLEDELDLMNDSRDNIDMINVGEIDELGRKHIQVIDNILLKKSEEMGLGIDSFMGNVNNMRTNSLVKVNERDLPCMNDEDREVLLSMPDLMEIESDIILGRCPL